MNGDIGIDSPPVLVATDDQQMLPANRICFIVWLSRDIGYEESRAEQIELRGREVCSCVPLMKRVIGIVGSLFFWSTCYSVVSTAIFITFILFLSSRFLLSKNA